MIASSTENTDYKLQISVGKLSLLHQGVVLILHKMVCKEEKKTPYTFLGQILILGSKKNPISIYQQMFVFIVKQAIWLTKIMSRRLTVSLHVQNGVDVKQLTVNFCWEFNNFKITPSIFFCIMLC